MNTETQTLKVTTSEEFRGEVTIYLNNKHQIKFPTQDLVDYVEAQELNISTENHGVGLVCDPNGTDDYIDVETPINDWLDVQANWDKAVDSYYHNIICK